MVSYFILVLKITKDNWMKKAKHDNQKIRLAYCVSTLDKAGPVNILYQMVKELDKDRFDITIISLSPEPANSRVNEFKELDCQLVNFGAGRGFGGFWALRKKFHHFLQLNHIDTLHAHCLRSLILIALLPQRFAIKRCATMHINPFEHSTYSYGFIGGGLLGLFQLYLFRRLDMVMPCSHSLAKSVERFNLKTRTIPNGVDVQEFNITSLENRNRLREQHNIPSDVPLFIVASRVAKEKNIGQILEVFANIKLGYRLMILGEGELLESYKQQYKSYSNIIFYGFVNNIREYMQMADFYISASKAEGMPCSVLEALACGVPVLLSNLDRHQEILDLAPSEVGLTFKLDDVNGLQDIIEQILRHQIVLDSEMAREWCKRRYSATKMAKGYEEAYLELN